MCSDIYKVQLENIFEGPMDLLVYLIRKNEVNICDIPISLITDRYLDYIEWMKSMNVDIAGDFLVMAATLIQIKSRMLLPVHDDSDEEDPRQEIARPLLEYLQMKSAAQQLNDRELLGEHTFIRSPPETSDPAKLPEREIRVDLFDLIQAFQRIMDNLSPNLTLNMISDKLSIQDRVTELIGLLKDKGSLIFQELISSSAGKAEIIITFLAILEMVKRNVAGVIQHADTGNITLYLNERPHAGTEVHY
ncbi:MAG: segregation/condensation protein A [Deltaproteobacteria bacterium]|nr:segregation/condensation protein A [Deltaproteobacteria bacterium]